MFYLSSLQFLIWQQCLRTLWRRPCGSPIVKVRITERIVTGTRSDIIMYIAISAIIFVGKIAYAICLIGVIYRV